MEDKKAQLVDLVRKAAKKPRKPRASPGKASA